MAAVPADRSLNLMEITGRHFFQDFPLQVVFVYWSWQNSTMCFEGEAASQILCEHGHSQLFKTAVRLTNGT